MKKSYVVTCVFLMITSWVALSMHNNTTIVSHNNTTLIPYDFNTYYAHYSGTPFLQGPDYSGPRNRKERRAQGQRKAELTPEDKAQMISNKIDRDLLGVENNGCCSTVFRFFNGLNRLCYLKSQGINGYIQELKIIDSYIQKAADQKVIPLLAQSDYFGALVAHITRDEALVNVGAVDAFVKGTTIDGFFDTARMFPDLSLSLGEYIGEKIKQKFFMQHCRFINTVTPKHQQIEHHLFDFGKMQSYKRKTEEIHMAELMGHEYPIDENTIMISTDEKYIKSADIFGNTIVWNTLTGEQCNSRVENIEWLKSKSDKNERIAITFFSNEKFYVSLCKEYFFCSRAEVPTLYLYVRPTLNSWLCQRAFFNSRDDNNELDALLKSDMVNKNLKGFVKKNMIRAIQMAKAQNAGL